MRESKKFLSSITNWSFLTCIGEDGTRFLTSQIKKSFRIKKSFLTCIREEVDVLSHAFQQVSFYFSWLFTECSFPFGYSSRLYTVRSGEIFNLSGCNSLKIYFPSPSYSTISSGFQQQNFKCLQRIQKDGAARLMHGTPSFRFQYSILDVYISRGSRCISRPGLPTSISFKIYSTLSSRETKSANQGVSRYAS